MSNPIVSTALIEWLIAAEIIGKDQHVRRVVIDIEVGEPVRIYIEEHGSDKMLTLIPPDLKGATVVILPAVRKESDVQN